MKNVRCSVFANNMFIWLPQENIFIDPELSSFGGGINRLFGEFSEFPSTKSIGVSLNIGF